MVCMCCLKFLRPYHIPELVLDGRFIPFLQWLSVVDAVIILTWQINSLKRLESYPTWSKLYGHLHSSLGDRRDCSLNCSSGSAEVTPLMGCDRHHSMLDTKRCTMIQFNPVSAWREDEIRLDPVPNSEGSSVSWVLALCMGSMINIFAFSIFLSFFQIVEN